MGARDLRKRGRHLRSLRKRLSQPVSRKIRAVLRKPQPLLMEQDDVLVYPVSKRGACINPYMADKPDLDDWTQDGWGAAFIVDCGRVFDYLAWYSPLKMSTALRTERRPDPETLRGRITWELRQVADDAHPGVQVRSAQL